MVVYIGYLGRGEVHERDGVNELLEIHGCLGIGIGILMGGNKGGV